MKKAFRLILPVFIILSMLLAYMPVHQAQAVSTSIVISQVYGAGGNSGATYRNDYVVLFNLSSSPISLSGMSIQYASASGTGNFGSNPIALLSGTLAPGQYYLVQLASGGTNGIPLPTPDATGTVNMSGTAGKVALVNSTAGLACNGGSTPCTPEQLALIIDLVGFGSTANFYEGSGPAPAPSTTTAIFRANGGCTDTDDNASDFSTAIPSPQNTSSPKSYCGASTNPTAVGLASPATVFPGDPVLLTLAVTAGTNPTSTGLAATCDLSAIGGSASQAFYDDGTNGDASAGDGTFSFAATVGATTPGGVNSLSCTITDAEARTGSASIGLTVTAILPIGSVNGPVADTDNGTLHRSPYAPASGNGMGSQVVTIQGVIYEKTLQAISGSANTYKGFYIQNTSATADDDPYTSDGLFVFMSTNSTIGGYTPQVGDEIILSGKISEYYFMTEMQSLTLQKIVRTGVDIDSEVPPVVANPPADLAEANRYWERLQGMRIQVPENSIVLGGRNVFSPADAEVWVAAPDSTIAQRESDYERRAFRDAHPLDDNYDPTMWDGNGYRILMGSLGIKAAAGNAQALIDPARTFDTVTNTPAGGLNYTYSKYRIEISEQPIYAEGVDPAANNPPTEITDRSVEYSVVDYNLENLYDYRDNPFSGCDFAGNPKCSKTGTPFLSDVTSPYDYVPVSDAVYQARVTDIATQIIEDLHNPDILMVQEVENQDICSVENGALVCGTTDNADGKPDTLQELALKVADLGGPEYDAAFDRDSSDLRGIAPAFLYRTDRVELLPAAGDPVLGANPTIGTYVSVPYDADVSNPKTMNAVLPAGITACETSWVFPRAVDIALFRVYSESIGHGSFSDVYVLNNHFKSGPDTCVAHRTEQAKYNAALIAFIEAANPHARIVMGGDLNVYPRPDDIALGATDQLGSLYDSSLGLKNLWEVLLDQAPEAAYSYVYLGMAQTLDQMFVNQPQLDELQEFRIAHINSDFPADYPDDVARGTSDHDPNVATFLINQPPTVDAGGPYTVDEGSAVTLTATGNDPEGSTLTYAWDLDNNGTFETPGQSVSFAGVDGPATFTVKVQATDSGNASTIAEGTVTVNNVAPTLGPITTLPGPLSVGIFVPASAQFTDPGVLDTHTASIDWGDGSTTAGVVEETNGSGTASGAHTYAKAGFYTVTMTVTDKDGAISITSTSATIIVVNPKNGYVTGGGWFNTPLGAYKLNPAFKGKTPFEISSKYVNGKVTPTGYFKLIVSQVTFLSNSIDWMVVMGKEAQIMGVGTINGSGVYYYLVKVYDGSPDKIDVKIWKMEGTTEVVIYDSAGYQPLKSGTISIHK